MGLFDWLKPKRDSVDIAPDCIWLSKNAKLEGIQREIAAALADPDDPDALFVVAHFQDCLDELNAMIARSAFDDKRIHVTLAAALEGRSSALTALDESHRILLVVGERHPLPSHDESVVEFARSLPCLSRIAYHASLEDALLRQFSGEWVEGILKKLGMKEDEAIESQMVSRRLIGAQKRIAGKAIGDLPANSAEEWLMRNCPTI
jgi:hypothetical protein